MKKIQERLLEEGIQISRKSLYFLLKKYETNFIADRKQRAKTRMLSKEHFSCIDREMEQNSELTSRQLQAIAVAKHPDLKVSLATIKRARATLGWMSKKARYCAMIGEVKKRKTWCVNEVTEGDLDFPNVIWTDECSIQLESCRKITLQKKGKPIRLSARPKHRPKIHVWGGISARGATPIVIFTGTLIATQYTRILEAAVVPFIQRCYPTGHRFQQDNDPKHTSRWAQEYFREKNINWWPTPASSPDFNPIENIWKSLKQYLRTNVKPRSVEELKAGVREFWQTLTPVVCQKYICHLKSHP